MSRTQGTNVSVERDGTGGMAKFEWTCPHCGQENYEFIISNDFAEVTGDFEADCECDWCDRTVTVECME